MKRSFFLVTLLLLLAAAAAAAPAAGEAPLAAYDSSLPINVSADRLDADDLARQVRFVGNVVARQGEVVIYADRLTLFYAGENREIERVEADGDVRIVQGERVATGQKGTLYRAEGRVVLTGSARVHQGEDFVEGDEIIVLLNEEKSIVQGREGGRVNAVFHPKEERP